jgi:hypothetical protein
MNGGRKREPGPDEIICPKCNGDSVIAYQNHSIECWRCSGSGCVKKPVKSKDGQ